VPPDRSESSRRLVDAGRSATLCALASLLGACRSPPAPAAASPPPGEAWLRQEEVERAGIAVAPVEEHDLDDVLVTNGRITFDEARVAHVLSPLSGHVVRIDADLGAHVRKGQALALIEAPDVGSATSDLNKATADLIAAEHAYERQKDLRQSNATSEASLEQAEDAWRTARAEHERAQQKVSLLHAGRAVTQLYPLTAPIDGDVLARNVTPGLNLQGTYSGGNSPELFTIGDLDSVWLMADVYETDLARVHEGAHVEVTTTALAETFDGTVDWLSQVLDPQTRTARLRCSIRNSGGLLKPEMYGTVRVSVAPLRALAIPRTAIVHLGEHAFVFVERRSTDDGRRRFERLPLTADETPPGDWVSVAHGLDRGDSVVVQGAQSLSARL
jgi:cobalt-zinc-cadmium efflux system membrane fusion protein